MTTSKKKPQITRQDPAEFDVDGFLAGFKPPVIRCKLHYRCDLIPEMQALIDEVKALDEAVPAGEKSFSDGDARTEKIARYYELEAEFEAGGHEVFEFVPRTMARVKSANRKMESRFRGTASTLTKQDRIYWATLFLMAEHCTSHPGITAQAFNDLQEKVGDEAVGVLARAFGEAYNGGAEPDAPFSQPPSPTPETPPL